MQPSLESTEVPGAENIRTEPVLASSRSARKKKKKKQRLARERDQSSFVVLADSNENNSDDTTDLESSQSSFAMRSLVEENALLTCKVDVLSTQMRGLRLLLREPSSRLVQRVLRGVAGRRRCSQRLEALVEIQSVTRTLICVSLRKRLLGGVVVVQTLARVRLARAVHKRKRDDAAAVKISSMVRKNLVLTTTPRGKLLAKTRRQAAKNAELEAVYVSNMEELAEQAVENAEVEANLEIVEANLEAKVEAAEAKITQLEAKLKAAKGAIFSFVIAEPVYTGEELKNYSVKIAAGAHEDKTILSRLVTALNWGPTITPAVAQNFLPQTKVEVLGSSKGIRWHKDDIAKKSYLNSHRGTITKVIDETLFEVTLDDVYNGEGETQRKAVNKIPASDMRIVYY